VEILKVHGDGGRLSLDPERNTAGVAALQLLRALGTNEGVTLELWKDLPLGSGLGSSAASAAAAAVAVNELFGNPFDRRDLVPFAMESERVACGSAHADNVAPAILGGFVLTRSYHPLDLVQLPVTIPLFCTVITPDVELRTEDARRLLKPHLPLEDAVTQFGNIAGLITALLTSDFDLLGRSLADVIIEPQRRILIPAFEEIRSAARAAGAPWCNISGSGPSLFAFLQSPEAAERVGGSMAEVFTRHGIKSRWYASPLNREGTKVVTRVV
jgi:homoserine kinase